ncbi:MAG: signal peptidase II [Candidatus Dormibacteria bacterium]
MVLVLVALAVFIFDRLTKVAVQNMPARDGYSLFGGAISIIHAQNTGAAFSMGLGMGKLFLFFAVAASIGIVYAYRKLPASELLMRVALGMILGGALGNAYDRVTVGSVTDWLDLHWWPVFNLADSCIFVGACLLAYRLWQRQRA